MDQSSSSSASTSQSGNALLDQAQQLLNQGNVSDLLSSVSPALKNVGSKVSGTYNSMSTTQKILGGALIAVGGYLLLRNSGGQQQSRSTDETDTLQELLLFVNDRIEGYRKAVEESQDAELRGYYKQLVSQSQQFSNELNAALRELGGGRQTETTLKGKFYRRFMDAKAAVTGRDEKAILGSNIYGEEWALKAYEDALEQGTLSGQIRLAVERQYALSQKTYDRLKSLQQSQK